MPSAPIALIENSEAGNSTKSQSSQNSTMINDEKEAASSCSLEIDCILLKSLVEFGSRLHGSQSNVLDQGDLTHL